MKIKISSTLKDAQKYGHEIKTKMQYIEWKYGYTLINDETGECLIYGCRDLTTFLNACTKYNKASKLVSELIESK